MFTWIHLANLKKRQSIGRCYLRRRWPSQRFRGSTQSHGLHHKPRHNPESRGTVRSSKRRRAPVWSPSSLGASTSTKTSRRSWNQHKHPSIHPTNQLNHESKRTWKTKQAGLQIVRPADGLRRAIPPGRRSPARQPNKPTIDYLMSDH